MLRKVLPVLLVALLGPVLTGCGRDPGGEGARRGASAPSTPVAVAGAASPSPIECPLHKKGIDPAHLRPFEKVEDWIAFLDKKDRDSWQKPDDLIAALGLNGKETVADLGAGSGYFTFRLSKVLSEGKVIAIEVEPEMVRHIHHKVMTDGFKNIEVVLASGDDPMVPQSADLVFVCDVLHHVAGSKAAWLSKLFGEMKAGTRLVLAEFKEGDLPEGPPAGMKIPRAEILSLLAGAGFVLVSEKDDLLPYQNFYVFKKP
jgi:SAM-dependent methyltransferase